MSEALPAIRSEFFGKDGFVPFIGFVEDVNDPKQSHRVKVRAMGWHPKSKPSNQSDDTEDALSTDDLPWARVAMPVTHAQQDRIGGKHGLLVGCCVFGCFLDGQDAQDPLVLSSLNFTAKSTDKNNRKELKGKDGKADPQDESFQKNYSGGKTTPNTNRRTKDEKGKDTSAEADVAGDTTLSDADATKCGGKAVLESAASNARKNIPNSKENPEGQSTDILQGDGMCGTIAHAQEDIQTKLKEMMPSQMSRFAFNDVVWDKFTGKYIDMNGILAQLATIICNELKMPINSSKSVKNELSRKLRATTLMALPDRDGFISDIAEKALSVIDDLFNGIFQQSFVDILCSLMMNMLTAMNNNNNDGDNDNRQGNRGPNANTNITNVEARCISETIVNNAALMTEAALEASYANAEAMAESGGGTDDTMGAIMGILGGLSSVMMFPLIQKYALRPDVFNAAGPMSQDILTKTLGCRQDRKYNTELGAMGSLMGFSGGGGGSGSSGGGSGSGSDNSRGLSRYQNVGFGGNSISDSNPEITNDLCDEAYQIPYRDGDPIPDKVDTEYNTPRPVPNLGNGGGGSSGGGNGGVPGAPDGGDGDTVPGDGNTNQPGGGINIGDGTSGSTPGSIGSGSNTKPRLDDPYIKLPGGNNGMAKPISLPSMDSACAQNFINGTPNQIVIIRKGLKYYFDNDKDVYKTFPSVFIKGYQGTPVPVVDRESGELVAVLTNCKAFSPNIPNVNVSIIPDNNETGITTDDPQYDITLGGFFIANTGFDYCSPRIRILDRDKGIDSNASAELTVVDGRIVDYNIINNGTAFKRIPEIEIYDDGTNCGTTGGYGAKLYPIMSVVERESTQGKKKLPPVNMSFCPSNQTNLF